MHRLTVSPGEWEDLSRQQLLAEIREFMAGLPPIPEDRDLAVERWDQG